MTGPCYYLHCRWKTFDGCRFICTCGGCMEPQKRDEAYSRYLDNQRWTRIIHKRERMRRMAEEGEDDNGKGRKDT